MLPLCPTSYRPQRRAGHRDLPDTHRRSPVTSSYATAPAGSRTAPGRRHAATRTTSSPRPRRTHHHWPDDRPVPGDRCPARPV